MMVGQLQAVALAGALIFGFAGSTGAIAAPVAAPNPTRPVDVRPITAVAAVTEAEDDLTNCSRARRRLWVDGEGWIVRRVTTCR